MKHKLTTSFVCTILFFTAAVYGQAPSYQHITYVEVPFVEIDVQTSYEHTPYIEVPLVEIDVQETNALFHIDQKIHQILFDFNAVCAQNSDPLKATKIFSRKYIRHDRAFANYSGSNKWSGAVYQSEVYPLENNPDYFMNYAVHLVPASYDTYTADFSPSQAIYKVAFLVYSKNQISKVNTPLDLSILKENQENIPTFKKTIYIGFPYPVLSKKGLQKKAVEGTISAQDAYTTSLRSTEEARIMNEKAQVLRAQTVHKARSIKLSIFILIVIVFVILFPLVLLIIGIVVAASTIKKEKKEHTRISREVQKIEALTVAGKITADEAAELKHAFGPVAVTETSREPDTHIKVIGILNIVMPVVQGLLLVFLFLFLGLGLFMHVSVRDVPRHTPVSVAVESSAVDSHQTIVTSEPEVVSTRSHAGPLVILVPIIVIALVFITFLVFRIIAAVALMKGRPWARIVIVVFAVLGITSIPIGTALGIYALWALIFRENAGLYFISDNKQ